MLGDESNQALHFSPQKKRWNLLLLIISLLHHYVTACKISPSFHWVKSLYAHYIEFCHNKLICFSAVALSGLNCVSTQLVFAWFAASQGVKRRWLCGCQDSYWNIQSLIQNQQRIILVILLILIHHRQTNMVAWGREGEVFIFNEIKYKPTSRLSYGALLSHKSLQKKEWDPVTQFQPYFWGEGLLSFYGSTFQYFTLAIRFLCLPQKAVLLILEMPTAGFCGTLLKYSS